MSNKKSIIHLPQPLAIGQFLPAATASVVSSAFSIVLATSFASLIYAGFPSAYLARGVGLMLFGTFALCAVIGLAGSLPGVIAHPQDNPTAILALVGAGIGAALPTTPPESLFATITAAVILTSLLTGLCLLLLGTFRLGSLIRYLPYPVVGGFLAGTGWLLVLGALRTVTNVPLGLDQLPALLAIGALAQWLPGLLLGLLLLWLTRRYVNPLVLPVVLVAAFALYYLTLRAIGIPIAEAQARGWLLGPFPTGGLWQPPSLGLLAQVEWAAIGAQAGTIGTVVLITITALLLNTSSMELIQRRDVDFNRDLRASGLANLVAGLGGSCPGYVGVSVSTLVHNMGATHRITSGLAALLCGATLLLGAELLSYFPKVLLAGLLFFLGLNFLTMWLYDAWFKLSKSDYLVIVAILVAIGWMGMLAGVGLGLALAVLLFVSDYSRIDIVKHALSGATYRSNVDRPPHERQLLRTHGDQIFILELQGFIFFGTASKLLDRVRQRLDTPSQPPPRLLLIDFRRVNGLDASAVFSFAKLKQLAQAQNMILLFTELSPAMRRQLGPEVLTPADSATWRTFPDLDHGMEWCEEQILAGLVDGRRAAQTEAVAPQAAELLGDADIHHLRQHMERRTVASGEYIIRQGEATQGIYFIESGQFTAQLDDAGSRTRRLRTMQPGVFVGELSFYTGGNASASVMADAPSTVYFLARSQLAELQATHPDVAAAFHAILARLVSERLMDATDTLRALMR
jgi:SulP family sulfate permease